MTGERETRLAAEALAALEGCPPPDRLAELVSSPGLEGLDSLRSHVAGCGSCASAVQHLETGSLVPGKAASSEKLPVSTRDRSDRLVEFVTGMDVVGSPDAPAEGEPQEVRAGAVWLYRAAASLVLAASLGVVGWIWSGGSGLSESLGALRASAALEPAAPVGRLRLEPRIFRWTPHPQASRYRVLLFDETMHQVWSGESAGNAARLDLPRGGPPLGTPGAWFTWQVVALGELGDEIARSPAAHFRMPAEPSSD